MELTKVATRSHGDQGVAPDDEFEQLLGKISSHTKLNTQCLKTLYDQAKRVCLDDKPGDFVECGVAAGGSSALLAWVVQRYSRRQRYVYAFDTFEHIPAPGPEDKDSNNLPADQSVWHAGSCSAPEASLIEICARLGTASIIRPVRGLFSQTLPRWRSYIDEIAVLHLDADWYQSTKDVMINLYSKVTSGGYIQVSNYSFWQGCKKAINEYEASVGYPFNIKQIDGAGVWFQRLHCLNSSEAESPVICPLTKSNRVRLIRTIDTMQLVNAYKRAYGVETAHYFQGISVVNLYESIDSGYQFFHPFVEGDSSFYAQLMRLPWYYMDWKWENGAAFKYIHDRQNVLEVGCGKGAFLQKLAAEKQCSVTGIELNRLAAEDARARGVNVTSEILATHVKENRPRYDAICSFQTVEHVADVRAFFEDCLTALVSNGKLIFSVPNQDSFLGLDLSNLLDMPPHHIGKWTEKAIYSMETIFPLRLIALEFEPLQDYHYDYFASVVRRTLRNDNALHDKLIALARQHPSEVRGHTFLAVFEKRAS